MLTTIAMQVYAGGSSVRPDAPGYAFWDNYLSDLGATHAWSGKPNHAAMLLFGTGLATIGVALVAFATTWRAFAFGLGRAGIAGIASEVFGCLSGCAFVALALAPVDRMLEVHNGLVVTAFLLLFVYVACFTLTWARNGATRFQVLSCGGYVAMVLVYFAFVIHAARLGIATARARDVLIVSQKIMAYASMAYVMFLSRVVQGSGSSSIQPE